MVVYSIEDYSHNIFFLSKGSIGWTELTPGLILLIGCLVDHYLLPFELLIIDISNIFKRTLPLLFHIYLPATSSDFNVNTCRYEKMNNE